MSSRCCARSEQRRREDCCDAVVQIEPGALPALPPTRSRRMLRQICDVSRTLKGAAINMATLTALLDHLYEGDVVDTADVARVSDTTPRSVSRWRSEGVTPRRESEERLLELRAVVDLARKVMRDDAARLWMRSPNPDLGYEKPLDLVAQGRYQQVIDLLLALAEGVTA